MDMTRNPRITINSLLLVLSLGFAGSALAADEKTEAVRAAADGFYSALNSMFAGELEPMKNVWSHSADVTYLGPDGDFRVGWDEVLADWEAQTAMNLGGHVEPQEMHITVGRDLAIVSNYEIGENAPVDGESRKVKIRATNLFRLEDGKWKMIGHHTDRLSFIQE
jgi:ketosteroid isomerase-like protein